MMMVVVVVVVVMMVVAAAVAKQMNIGYWSSDEVSQKVSRDEGNMKHVVL